MDGLVMTKRVILDVDTGCDDAQALLLALRSPTLDVVGVTCVSGNVDVYTVCEATMKVLDAAQAPSQLPVARGFDRPLIEPVVHCPQIHGIDGLGDLRPPQPASTRTLVDKHAVELIIELLETTEREGLSPITLIALAPLTNIACVLRLRPELVAKRSVLERIVWMGGSAFAGGNASQWGEANAEYDPEATQIVLSSGEDVPITMYPWDVYLDVSFSHSELVARGMIEPDTCAVKNLTKTETKPSVQAVTREGSASSSRPAKTSASSSPSISSSALTLPTQPSSLQPWAALSVQLLLRDMRHFGNGSGTDEPAMIGDAGAVAWAIDAAIGMETRRMHVAAETRGVHTRGMTVVDPRGRVDPPDRPKQQPNVDVILRVDAAAVKRIFADAVLTLPPGREPPKSTAATVGNLEGEGANDTLLANAELQIQLKQTLQHQQELGEKIARIRAQIAAK